MRDYLYITDLLEALLLAGLYDGDENYYILGCDNNYTISDVWDIMSENLGGLFIQHVDTNVSKMEKRSYVANYDKFKKLTGWYPKVNINDGIEKTISQFKK